MFKFPELSDEQKQRVDERQAQESCIEQVKEEQYRRKWCIETAVCLEETRPENLFDLANKIYSYVYGAQ